MSLSDSSRSMLIAQLQDHLKSENYSPAVQRNYPTIVEHFLNFCDRENIVLEELYPEQVTMFLREQYELFQLRHSDPPAFQKWCQRHTAPIHMLLRLVRGTWPIEAPPKTALETFHRDIVDGYDTWLGDERGLSLPTRAKRTKRAFHFLRWFGKRTNHIHIQTLCVSDIDAYLQESCRDMQRASIEDVTVSLRDALRYLHRSERLVRSKSRSIIQPCREMDRRPHVQLSMGHRK